MHGGRVILLNADYTFLNAISWKRAVRLMVKNKVDVLNSSGQQIGPLVVPQVLRLIKRVRKLLHRKVGWSKRGVFLRNRFTCQYCRHSGKHHKLTLDHVLPRSRGVFSNWSNTVTACGCGNNRKVNKTPEEVYMPIFTQRYQPSFGEMAFSHLDSRELFGFILCPRDSLVVYPFRTEEELSHGLQRSQHTRLSNL